MGNYEETSESNEEKPEDHKNTEKSQNDSQTTEFPTWPGTDQFLSTSDEIATVATATFDAPDDDDDDDEDDDDDSSDDDDDDV